MSDRLISSKKPHSDKPQESRKARRVSYACAADWLEDGVCRTGEITDLSTSGAYMETPIPARKGACIQVKFQADAVQIETTGVVMHQTRGIEGMGICFSMLTPEQEAAIQKVVHGRPSLQRNLRK